MQSARFIFVFVLFQHANTQTEDATEVDPGVLRCDNRNDLRLSEGNIGESSNFPWLGVLRVYYFEKDQTKKVALTGLVLVTYSYALVSADDIIKIPESSLPDLAKAHFVATDDASMFAKPTKYTVHPEYGFSSDATIALVFLELVDELYHPISPVCLPILSGNAPTRLYALGYTDENFLLEKTISRIEYVNKTVCDEFYDSESTKANNTPVYYQCGLAKNTNLNCTWENGMVMASNDSGRWTLIGFSFKGPACRLPGRFLDIKHYTVWIESSTDIQEIKPQDYYTY